MSNYTLTYRKGRSQEIYIEEIGKERHLYFQQEYNNALKLVKEIVDLQRPENDNENAENGKERQYENKKIAKYGCNNRILFAGQRGCGKTSLMRSLADYLAKPEKELNYKNWEKIDFETKFCCLPMVDPSHFDNNNNILLTVITSMFSTAKKKMETNNDKDESAEREDLLKQFEKVFKSLDSIKSELSSYTLESLNRKSDSEDLREKMNILVRKFLKYVVGNKEARLILLIDDIDMSVSYASEMLEQLRKYLELDNLIVLMSANLSQLTNEMREKYSSAFQYTLKDSNQALSIDVEDLATKYLLKLFPTSRRINVERHVSQLLETNLIIKNEKDQEILKDNTVDGNDKGNFQKVILSLIWNRTRLIFVPKDKNNTLHPIIPTNLRDLAQFLDMLTTLPEVKYIEEEEDLKTKSGLFSDKKDYDFCEHNLQVFKDYVMKTWIPNHLTVEEELVFSNIPTDITEINKHLINSINVIGTRHKTRLMSREVSLDMIERNAESINIDRDIYTMVSPNDPKFVKANKISDIFNQPSNYSYGDLLLMIDKYETYFESEEDRRITDAIKIYYSILLFETMFFKTQNVVFNFDNNKSYKEIPIQRLIGGNVYYPNYFEIITDKNFNQKGPSFDAKRAFYHKVKVDKNNKVGENFPLFSVLYYGDIRPDRYEKDHIYDTTFSKNAEVDGVNYVTFDILSVFNNMLNPCHTLSRIDSAEYRPNNSKWNKIVKAIQKWGVYNIIDGKYIPNTILPFYAVDVMLTYLRHDYSTDELFDASKEVKPILTNAKNAANSNNIFFDGLSSKVNEMIIYLKLLFELKKSEVNTDKINMLNVISDNLTMVKNKDENKKDILNEFAAKSWLAVDDKKKLERFAQSAEVLSEDENGVLTKIAEKYILILKNISKYLMVVEDKDKCEGIASKSITLSSSKKNELKVIASKEWVVEKDKKVLMQIANINGFLSDADRRSLNDIAARMYVKNEDKLIQDVFYAMMGTDIDDIRLLIEDLGIISVAHDCFVKISLSNICEEQDHKESFVDLYRNHVIALILGKSIMTKKEKEGLIKELHKYFSVSEIFKHIIEVMWENRIKEICIRGKIQEKVRSFEVVQTYYGKLWDETQKMFKMIDGIVIDGIEPKLKPVSIYENLFNEANKFFLKKQ